MKRTNELLLTVIVGILVFATGHAKQTEHSFHLWHKVFELDTVETNADGARLRTCTWRCATEPDEPHEQQTEGYGYCPHPS